MADEYDIQQSLLEQDEEFLMQNRQYTWIPDSNGGSYAAGSQIVIDGSPHANSGKYFSAANSFIQIPLVMTLQSVVGNLNNITSENDFALSLKNGYHQLVHSMSVEISNNSVVSTTSYTNMHINYKLLTTMSVDDERNFGPSIGFVKDDAQSLRYVSADPAYGLGEMNNTIVKSLFDPALGYNQSSSFANTGRLQRMQQSTSYDPLMKTNETIANVIASGKNYCQRDSIAAATGANTGTVVNHYITATLPLNILSDLFAKLPLVKGMYLKIVLNLNTNCSSSMVLGEGKLYKSVTSSSQNNVIPFMISPCITTQGLNAVGAVACTSLQASIAVAKNSFSGTTYSHPTLSQVRLYASLCDLSPSCEQMYLSKMPTKQIKYNDIMQLQLMNVAANSSFSHILTNGVSRVRRLIGIPKISSLSNYAGATSFISPMASPFTSCPGTVSGQSITNFNVLLSGVNVFAQNLNYGFETFFQELRKANSINGGNSIGLSSGLLSQYDFENAYRYLCVDLSRKSSEAVDNISKSIQVVLQ